MGVGGVLPGLSLYPKGISSFVIKAEYHCNFTVESGCASYYAVLTLHSTAMMCLHINSSPWMGLDVQASDRYARSVREDPGCVRASGYWSGVAVRTLQGGQRSACQRGPATCQVQVPREAKDYCQQEVVRGRLEWNVVSAMSLKTENIGSPGMNFGIMS